MIRGKFDETKLAQYVIDVMFWMHDGFNIDEGYVPAEGNLIISPQVVLNVIERIKSGKVSFFRWGDYMASANHSPIRKFFETTK